MSAPFPPEQDRDVLESSPRWGRAASLLERLPRWLMLTVVILLLAGGGAVLVIGHGGSAGPRHARPAAHTVFMPDSCAQYDNGTSAHLPHGLRTVFGDLAVPPAYLPLGPTGRGKPWRYGMKTAFYFRGDGPPVTVSVPAGWQRQVSMFGPPNGIDSTARLLQIPSCPPRGSWVFYVTSFYSSTQDACVPLDVHVGRRTAEFWFGLGVHCPAGVNTGPRIPPGNAGQAPPPPARNARAR